MLGEVNDKDKVRLQGELRSIDDIKSIRMQPHIKQDEELEEWN